MSSVQQQAEAANQNGNKLFLEGKVKEAIEEYARAIGMDSKTPKFYSNRSWAYLQNGKPQKALKDAQKAIQLDDKVAKYHYRCVCALMALENYKEADQAVTALLTVEPNNEEGKILQKEIKEKLLERERELEEYRMSDKPGYENKVAGEKYCAARAAQPNVHKLPSGMLFSILKMGQGEKSPLSKTPCEVHYTGRLIDGNVFDSSVARGEPASFSPDGVIPGWTEALQLMGEGDKWEVIIPFYLGYGARGYPPDIPPFSTLVFEMELLKVQGGDAGGTTGTGTKTRTKAIEMLEEKTGKKYTELLPQA